MRERPDIPRPTPDVKVKRALDQLIRALGADPDLCTELHITADKAHVVELVKNEAGEFYRDGAGQVAQRGRQVLIDTVTDEPEPEPTPEPAPGPVPQSEPVPVPESPPTPAPAPGPASRGGADGGR